MKEKQSGNVKRKRKNMKKKKSQKKRENNIQKRKGKKLFFPAIVLKDLFPKLVEE